MRRTMPTLRELGEYLTRLGYTHRRGVFDGDPIHIYEHPTARPPRFRFPDYPMDEPLPGFNVEPIHYQLAWGGVIPDIPFDDFLAQFAPARAG